MKYWTQLDVELRFILLIAVLVLICTIAVWFSAIAEAHRKYAVRENERIQSKVAEMRFNDTIQRIREDVEFIRASVETTGIKGKTNVVRLDSN